MILAFQNRKKIAAFAQGCAATWVDLAGINTNTEWPMIFSGITTMAPIAQARRHGLDYYYIDTGYFGNAKKKNYLRVTKNAYHNWFPIVERPRDRLDIASPDLKEPWLRHLSYSQFTHDEMSSGLAWAIVSTQQTVDILHHCDFPHQSSAQH